MVAGAAYHPFPTIDERAAWEGVPAEVRARNLAHGEQALAAGWPPLLATQYLDFSRTGNRARFEACYFVRRTALGQLVTAECLEGKGRFLDAIIAGLWTLCEESTWVLPAHCHGALPDPAVPNVDLFAAETGALVSWITYLLAARLDAVTPIITARLRHELRQRILDPFLTRTDYWWMGMHSDRPMNNWSPWCTSNCLSAILLHEEDAGRRAQGVAKALWILDRFLAGYHPDGGCDEGPGYWSQAGASLFDALELLYGASNGAIDVYDVLLIQEIGRYIQRVHISGNYYIDFADAAAVDNIPGNLVYRYGRRIGDDRLAAFGASQATDDELAEWYPFFRQLPTLFDDSTTGDTGRTAGVPPARVSAADIPCLRDTWLPGIQVMAARERDDDRGFYLAAKGGHNGESHNHNDVGQCIVYCDGRPVLIDVGVGTYTQQTFSAQRYDIWTMQSAFHNLPTVNGVQQAPGTEFTARDVHYSTDDAGAVFALDLAPAYPPEAGITAWQRTCRLSRRERVEVEITDEFTLTAPTDALYLSLMTACLPVPVEAGLIVLSDPYAGELHLRHDPSLMAGVELIAIDDDRLRPAWGDRLYRILLTATAPVTQGKWVLQITRQRSDYSLELRSS